jgi:hypothetical protein
MSTLTPAVIFTSGHKGGPGKSTFSRGLIDYYRARGITTSAYDADASTESLAQYLGLRGPDGRILDEQDPTKGVETFNVRNPDQKTMLLDIAGRQTARIVVDLPGGGVEDVAEVLTSTDRFFQVFEDAGVTPIVAIIFSNVKASIASVPGTIQLFGPRPRYVAVKNMAFGPEFPTFDGVTENGTLRYQGAKRALTTVGGQIMEMPKIDSTTYGRLDLYDLSFADAVNAPQLRMTDRERIKLWRTDFAAALEGTILAVPAEVLA